MKTINKFKGLLKWGISMSSFIKSNIELYTIIKEKQEEYLWIIGWAFSIKSNNPLTIKVDHPEVTNVEISHTTRKDVFKVFPAYGGSLNSGFTIKIYDFKNKNKINIRFEDKERGYSRIYPIDINKLIFQKRKKEKENVKKNEFQKNIIFVSHDATFSGASLLALNIIKTLKETFNYKVHVMLKSRGFLENEFRKYATVYNLDRDYSEKENLIGSFYDKGIRIAICNTVVTGDIVKALCEKNIKTISLIHELPGMISTLQAENKTQMIFQYAEKIVFPSPYVKMQCNKIINVKEEKVIISPQGLFNKNNYKYNKFEAHNKLREQLNIPQDSNIVLGVGCAELRKGVDLFVEVALKAAEKNDKLYFVWVGSGDKFLMDELLNKAKKSYLKDKIIFCNIQRDLSLFYSGSDIYLMTSREDPFPSVVLEAMDAELPVIGFNNAGGFIDIVTKDKGILVPYLNVDEMSKKVIELINNDEVRRSMGKNSRLLIEEKFNFNDYVFSLLKALDPNHKKISVIIPNYNYARYLEERLTSIINQTYPIYEIILLDDASTDNSLEVMNGLKWKYSIDFKLIRSTENSGSVFKQWVKGISMAKGDYIWIAEADDTCEEEFLEEVMKGFQHENAVLSYSQSKQIDSMGKVIQENCVYDTDDIDVNKWRENYSTDGIKEISTALAIKNTIQNASAVVFKKIDMSEIMDELSTFKVGGDWFFYVWLLQKGNISYTPKPLNRNRRHDQNVTKREDKALHYEEIVKIQNYIMNQFVLDENVIQKVNLYRDKVRVVLEQ